MAAPNIVTTSTINGRTAISNPGNTSPFFILSNASGSNHVYKINSITLTNQNGYSAVAKVNRLDGSSLSILATDFPNALKKATVGNPVDRIIKGLKKIK